MTQTAETIKTRLIHGKRTAESLPVPRVPPQKMSRDAPASMKAVSAGAISQGKGRSGAAASLMHLTCTALPMPSEDRTVNTAKKRAAALHPRARSMYAMG